MGSRSWQKFSTRSCSIENILLLHGEICRPIVEIDESFWYHIRMRTEVRDRSLPPALNNPSFRRRHQELQGVIVPGLIVPDDVRISILGNSTLLPNAFDLRDIDTLPLNGCHYPGRSAHIAFTTNAGIAHHAIFGREKRRTDHLYSVRAGELLETGFVAVFAPVHDNPLHVRLVHAYHTNGSTRADVPHQAKVNLAALFQRHKVQ